MSVIKWIRKNEYENIMKIESIKKWYLFNIDVGTQFRSEFIIIII